MKWFNEPEKWNFNDGKLTVRVTPRSDYWRKTHYGFTADNGPFYFTEKEGNFEMSVKITGDYRTTYDQMGLMLRLNEKHWIKTGIEYVDGVHNFSTVITHNFSSWNIIPLPGNPASLWIKAVRKSDAVEIFYSLDGIKWQMANIAYFAPQGQVMAGMMSASPQGTGFDAVFENFHISETVENDKEI
jgi:regulation of enolase protein 1 (concanavalin A-like superfamily)